MKHFLYFALLIGIFAGCRNKTPVVVNPSAIRKINFYVRYLEATHSLYAEALFEGDSSMRIKSGVFFQGKTMRETKLPAVGWRYQADVKSQTVPDSVFFEFTNTESETIKYGLTLPKLPNPQIISGGFTKKTGGVIAWDGAACTDDDALVIRLTDSIGTSYNFNHIGMTRGAKVEIMPPQFKDVALGKASIAVTRRHIQTEKTKAGTIILVTTEYYMDERPTIVGKE